jgi:hypothetical protein
VSIHVDQHGLDEIGRGLDTLAHRATELLPLGDEIRRRWSESERRLFATRPWPARKESTVLRYRWPVVHSTDEQPHRVTGDTMHFTGFLERLLTAGRGSGLRDTARARAGGLDVEVGIDGNGPAFYGAFAQRGAGSRRRRPVVVFDPEAHRDATDDVADYLLAEFGDRP